MITVILGIAAIYFAVGFLLALTLNTLVALNFSMLEVYERYKDLTEGEVEYSTFKYLFYPVSIFAITTMYPLLIVDVYKKRKSGHGK